MLSGENVYQYVFYNPPPVVAARLLLTVIHQINTGYERVDIENVRENIVMIKTVIFDEMRRLHHIDTRDNETCANAIRRQDELDVEIKLLQQEYHSRFMLILPAGKVMRIIKAEEKFHRQMFKRMRAQ